MFRFIILFLLMSGISYGQDAPRVSKKNSVKSDKYYNEGFSKYDKKDLEGARTAFTKAIEYNPYDPRPYYGRAAAEEKLKEYNQAIYDCSKAIELDGRLRYLYLRGQLY